MAAVLVTLAQAKTHLRITTPVGDPGEADIQQKLDDAEASILDYLKSRADPLWVSPATVPGPVRSSILLLLARLYEHRGDADEADAVTWEAIGRLLARLRDPALA